jgi:hypothetical protein
MPSGWKTTPKLFEFVQAVNLRLIAKLTRGICVSIPSGFRVVRSSQSN